MTSPSPEPPPSRRVPPDSFPPSGPGRIRPSRRRRSALLPFSLVLLSLLPWPPGSLDAQGVTVTDIQGRRVAIPAGPHRLLIDDARFLVALSLLDPDPVALLAGWPRDINRLGERTYQQYLQHSPRLASVPQVSSSAGTFSLELALAAEPTVAIFTAGLGPDQDDLSRFAAAGIPVVFLDFVSRPLQNMDRSLEILGEIIGRRSEADEVVALRRRSRDLIASRLAGVADRPAVFLETHAGLSEECCTSPGRGSLGEYIVLAGGRNVGDVLPGASGRLNLEYILEQDPPVYILTGGPHLEQAGGLVLGSGYSADRARRSLEASMERVGLRYLAAVRSGRVHGVSHQLLISPLDVVALELFARWIHPGLFADLDPAATLAALNARMAVPLDGTHWTDLP